VHKLSSHRAWKAFIPHIQIEGWSWVGPVPLQPLYPKPQSLVLPLCHGGSGLPVLEANDLVDKDSPFYYDWEGLQLGGVICAALLCIAGILFALSEQWDWWGRGGGGEQVANANASKIISTAPYPRKLFHSSLQ
ncbi:hypothetical protein EI555_002476, partial [Monodon monoceros]